MVPKHFIFLKTFPFLKSGKIDVNALPLPTVTKKSLDDMDRPKTEIEQTLLSLWKDILKLDDLSVNDNFFLLGVTL